MLMWAYRPNMVIQDKYGSKDRMWAYRTNVDLKTGCGPIGQMWSYRTNMGLYTRCGLTDRVWTYMSNVVLQDECGSRARLSVPYRKAYRFSFGTGTYRYRCVSVYRFEFIGIFENFELYIYKKY